ncbi:MAG TPA: ATP-binding protein [Burkholderiaceae bacterium]|nr:ATP-binding protein [Burkholderiaceae bacterium]
MKRLFADTLFRRLFVLLWVALVAAHLLGRATFDWVGVGLFPYGGPPIAGGPPPKPRFEEPRSAAEGRGTSEMPRPGERAGEMRQGDAPRSGEAPPSGETPRSGDAPRSFDRPPAGGDGSRFDRAPGERRFDGPPRPLPPRGRHMLWLTLLDLLVRGIVITVAAWWGARWLVEPISRFSRAAESLGTSLDSPPIAEDSGPVEVRQAARLFNEMRDRLRHQFAERTRFLAAVSHDLRTPLTRIRLRLENLPDDANTKRCEQDIAEMNAMIDSVLQYLRDEADPEPRQALDLYALAEALVEDLRELGRPATISGSSAIVRVQPLAIRRCLTNLLDNAIRYGLQADVTVQREGRHTVVTIDDAGPGVDETRKDQMFEPFVRLDGVITRTSVGTGLGLYIAREIAQRNGGELTLENLPRGGLRAKLRFPATGG